MFRLSTCVVVGLLLGTCLASAANTTGPLPLAGAEREFDARAALNRDFSAELTQLQRNALNDLRTHNPGISVTKDVTFGGVHTLHLPGGYLTLPSTGTPWELALGHVSAQREALGLTLLDLDGLQLRDQVYSSTTGATHVYLQQTHLGLPVYNAQIQIHLNRDGRVLFLSSGVLPQAAGAANSEVPSISAIAAVQALSNHIDYVAPSTPELVSSEQGDVVIHAPGLSVKPVHASLAWLPIRQGQMRLVWNFQILPEHRSNHFDVTVDAHDGRVWTRRDWVDAADYRVFEQPVESPIHSPMPPPADGRSLVSDPEDAIASPNGWHQDATTSYTTTRGNNVRAFDDATAGDPSPDCGAGLSCDFEFPIDFATADPRDYTDAAVANLFYWVNIVHDVQYQYGFDEVAGNFQNDNFGNGGVGGDEIDGRGQSNSGLCPNNAFFGTPPDGGNGDMIMCLWTNSTPRRDFSWDSGVLVHEIGHGISNRLVGGPSNASCIGGQQRAGEGYSDWWSLVYTATPSQTGPTIRGSGTYILGQPIDGGGVRAQPYSTDPAVNSYSYETIRGLGSSHAIGSVWAQVGWEVYWALVDKHGFDPDLYNATGGAGNQRAMFYVNEALKMVPCDHTFADMRDAMLQVAGDNFGGADVCPMWEAFAGIGLGEDADPASTNSNNVTNGFEVPQFCDVLFADGLEDLP